MYEPAIVTFLDILGFGDLVETSPPETINRLIDAIERFTMPVSPEEHDLLPKVFQFSDSIIRVTRLKSQSNIKYPVGLMFLELQALVHIQLDLIREGLLIRGGVALGDVFISGSRVFGPAVISAYRLESTYALYPRIIISPELLQEYKKNPLLKALHHTFEMDAEHIQELLCQGDDGLLFVDYARAAETELDEDYMYANFLKIHRKVILEKSKEFKSLSRKMSKYLWLASYHNKIVLKINDDWFQRYDIDRNDLLISSDEFESLQYFDP